MTSAPKFSLTAILLGTLFLVSGIFLLTHHVQHWLRTTKVEMTVTELRDGDGAIQPGVTKRAIMGAIAPR